MKRKQNLLNMLLAFLLLLIFGCLAYLLFSEEDSQNMNEDDDFVSQSGLGTIEYEGKKYRYNSNLFNILFMGIDNNEELREHDLPGEAGQADAIMILSLNKETMEGHILQIPRDTMTEIDIYDGSGNRYKTVERQLALQFAYGSGGENSCWAMKKTVSELLYDLPLDGYLALDIAALPMINDAVGGVMLTIPEDYTMIDPAFEKGATLTLSGEQAQTYIQYRDTAALFSNQERMERQLHYIPALISAIKESGSVEKNYYDIFYPLVSEYMFTDLREDQIDDLSNFNLLEAEMEILSGEWYEGEEHDEYHVDAEKIRKNLLETFYILEE